METNLPSVPDRKDVDLAKLFENSIFPPRTQRDFVTEIRQSALAALSEKPLDSSLRNKSNKFTFKAGSENGFYLINSHRRYFGATNVPFIITVNPQKYSKGEYYQVGPVDILLVSTLAYLEQENAAILTGRDWNQEVSKILEVESPQAFAQGLSTIVDHIGSSGDHYPRFPVNRFIETVLENTGKRLILDINEYKDRLKFYQREFKFSKGTITKATNEYQETLVRLKGFEKGKLLLKELLHFSWGL